MHQILTCFVWYRNYSPWQCQMDGSFYSLYNYIPLATLSCLIVGASIFQVSVTYKTRIIMQEKYTFIIYLQLSKQHSRLNILTVSRHTSNIRLQFTLTCIIRALSVKFDEPHFPKCSYQRTIKIEITQFKNQKCTKTAFFLKL